MEYLSYTVLVLVMIYLIASTFLIELPLKKNSLNSYCQEQKDCKLKEKGYFSDKLKAKEYLEKEFPSVKYAKVIHSTSNPETLKKIKFPERFVMKSSTGARMFHIGNNKDKIPELIKKAKGFLNTRHSNFGYRSIPFMALTEPHYDYNTDPKIFIEEFLEGIKEFRIMMAKGQIIYLEKIQDDILEYYNEKWEPILDPKYDVLRLSKNKQKPKCIEEILKFCKDFYEKTDFQLVRMDFYLNKDETEYYFGEFTFTPENCRRKYSDTFHKKYKNLFG